MLTRAGLLAVLCLGCGRVDFEQADGATDPSRPDAGLDGGRRDASADAAVDGGRVDAGAPRDAATADSGPTPDGGSLDAGNDAGSPPLDAGSPTGCEGTVVIEDDFVAPGTAADWFSFANAELTLVEMDGRLQVIFPSSVSSGQYAYYLSAGARDLSGFCVTLEVPVVPNVATRAITYLKVVAGTRAVEVATFEGVLYARSHRGGDTTIHGTSAYDAAAHRFWRIRESAGVFRYEVSADGVVFTQIGTLTDAISLTSAHVELGAGAFQAETDPGSAQFESVSIRVAP